MDDREKPEEVSLEKLGELEEEGNTIDIVWDKLYHEVLDSTPTEKGLSPLDWYVYSKGKEAVILDEGKMSGDRCICLTNNDKKICLSNFALGVLSPEQVNKCGNVDERVMPKEITELMEAARECGGEKGITEWSACVAKRAPGAVSEYPE